MRIPIFEICLISILFLYASLATAQSKVGAPLEAIANASSTLTNIWSNWNNPAGISQLEQTSIGVSYRVLQDVEGFNTAGLAIGHPLKVGALGFGVSRFGDQLYNEQHLSLSYANKFGITDLGLQIAYHQYHFEGFGTKGVPVISFGGITSLSDQFLIGASIRNINQTKISDFQDERVPTIMQVGISYRPLENIMVNVDLQKDIDFDTSILIGLSYAVIDNLILRTGFNTNPTKQFFGLEFRPNNLKGVLSYSMSNQQLLGLSHQMSMQYDLRIKK